MKILRLIIHSFGNLHEKIIDFSGDTNVIMGTDENMVSTVEAFIDGMLFGLSENDKKKYRPRRMPYRGTLFFENDQGEQVQIERNFLNDTFKATDVDGNDISEDYTDEFGSLEILPTSDSIFAQETITIPDITDKELKKLDDLKKKKISLNEEYKVGELSQERDELAQQIEELKKLQHELTYNQEVISKNEERVRAITGDTEKREQEINSQILSYKSEIQKIDLEIEKLKNLSNTNGTGKAQILRRDIKNYDERIKSIDQRLTDLENEKLLYTDKLRELKGSFPIDRKELKEDYNKFQNEEKQSEISKNTEPLVSKLMDYSTWIYGLLIICGIAAIAVALYNPNDALTKPPIFLISFVSLFAVLSSAVIIYLQLTKPVVQPVGPSLTESEVNGIIKKYNQGSKQEFEIFFNEAKKIYSRMDNMEADLNDIENEIQEAQREKDELLSEEHEINIDLHKNRAAYENTDIDEKVFELTKKRNRYLTEIDDLVDERKEIKEDSIWKLREESLILDEKNQQLLSEQHEYSLEELQDKFNKVQKKIDQFTVKSNKLNDQIKNIENKISNYRMDYINSFASPGESDYDEKLAQQFNFGLQNNLRQHNEVPFITFNPFGDTSDITQELIDKFKLFIENNQTLIFTTEFEDLDLLRKNKIKYNGIFIR